MHATRTFREAMRAQTESLAGPWRDAAVAFFGSPDGEALCAFIDRRIAAGVRVFPPRPLHALELTPLQTLRVVILGQDPYHGAGQAHGLAFSVLQGVRFPPSLRNVLLELRDDLGIDVPMSGDLTSWARSGVLLMNTVLTVEEGSPGSHADKGWEHFTDRIIEIAAHDSAPKVFLLWGAHAQAKTLLIESAGRHLVLRANHPSPLAARRPPLPFLGCRHFSRANALLAARGREAVDWRL
jgi:uracil-DNA glycosylase